MTVQLYKTFVLPDGSKRKVRFTGKTRKEAERKRDAAIRELMRGQLSFDSRMTVARYAEGYIERRCWDWLLNRMDIAAGAQLYRNQITQHSMIGRDLTPYYLRHTYRTNLAEWGVNPLVAAYWMGHAEGDDITDIGYAHLTPAMIEQAASIVEQASRNKKGTFQQEKTSVSADDF